MIPVNCTRRRTCSDGIDFIYFVCLDRLIDNLRFTSLQCSEKVLECVRSTHFSTCRLPDSHNITCNFFSEKNSSLWDDKHIQKCFLILHQMAQDHGGALIMHYTFSWVEAGHTSAQGSCFSSKEPEHADRTLSGGSVAGSFLAASLSVRAEGCSSGSVMFTQLSILFSPNTELQGPTGDVTRCQSITAAILRTGKVSGIWWVSQGIVSWVTANDFFLLFLFWVESLKTQRTEIFSKWLCILINTVLKLFFIFFK